MLFSFFLSFFFFFFFFFFFEVSHICYMADFLLQLDQWLSSLQQGADHIPTNPFLYTLLPLNPPHSPATPTPTPTPHATPLCSCNTLPRYPNILQDRRRLHVDFRTAIPWRLTRGRTVTLVSLGGKEWRFTSVPRACTRNAADHSVAIYCRH